MSLNGDNTVFNYNSGPHANNYGEFNLTVPAADSSNKPYGVFSQDFIVAANYLYNGANACSKIGGYPLPEHTKVDYCAYNLPSLLPQLPHNQCEIEVEHHDYLGIYATIASSLSLLGVAGLLIYMKCANMAQPVYEHV
jgi:hypothetical protein